MSKLAKSVGNNRAIPLMQYTGPKKVIPPLVPTVNTTGISYKDVCAWQVASLVTAHEKDKQWFNNLSQRQDAMEWNGFNNQLSRSQDVLKSLTTYIFGPMIDAPLFSPRHHPHNILIHAEVTCWHGDDICSSFCWHAAICNNQTSVLVPDWAVP